MNFRVIQHHDLENAQSPFRVTQQNGPEVDWVNRFLDRQRVRSVAETTLRSYAYDLLHFLRWWVGVNHTTAITPKALDASALLDYIRFQTNQQPRPAAASINRRVGTAERALRLAFPDAPAAFLPDFQYGYWRPRPLSAAPSRPALSRLRVRAPKRVIVPLSNQEVARFWAGFRTSRDLAILGLMLFDGLRSGEVRALNRDDLLLSEAQLRVHGRGGKPRCVPLAQEILQLLGHYLLLERPSHCDAPLFVNLKGPSRGGRITDAGMRSLFRHHRKLTQVLQANPHRFRHTFALDMVRAGISLPAWMKLMGHANIQTTLEYLHISSQDVYQEYTRAVAQPMQRTHLAQP
ncbi:MAG TPA: tyrosine-type recombinase/integrase [Candidatus Angelobacter sp.]